MLPVVACYLGIAIIFYTMVPGMQHTTLIIHPVYHRSMAAWRYAIHVLNINTGTQCTRVRTQCTGIGGIEILISMDT